MSLRRVLGLLIPLACAALFIRLGLWQRRRHIERQAFNAVVAARLATPEVDFEAVPTGDSASVRGRRVRVSGSFRYELEQVVAGRVSEGSPGVYLLTPLEIRGSDTLLVIVRGWVYSPDAASIELRRWREKDSVTVTGYLIPLPDSGVAAPVDASKPLRQVSRLAVRTRIQAPVFPVQLVMTSDSAPRADSVPRRLPAPTLEIGPHRSYMWQWFGFAVVAVVGGLALFRRHPR